MVGGYQVLAFLLNHSQLELFSAALAILLRVLINSSQQPHSCWGSSTKSGLWSKPTQPSCSREATCALSNKGIQKTALSSLVPCSTFLHSFHNIPSVAIEGRILHTSPFWTWISRFHYRYFAFLGHVGLFLVDSIWELLQFLAKVHSHTIVI